MSYILDALKRAEKERKLGQAPAALDEIATPQMEDNRSRRHWLLIGACAVLVVAAVTYGAVKIFSGGASPSAPQVATTPTVEPQAAAAVPAPELAATQVPPVDATATGAAPAGDQAQASPEGSPADAKIEGGDNIASLDDLTGDGSAAAQQQVDNGGANDPEANLPPSGPTVDLGASQQQQQQPAAATQAPPPAGPTIVRPEIPSQTAPASRSQRAAATEKPRASPPPPLPKTAVDPSPKSSSPAPAARSGPRAPPAGPVVVLGDQGRVIEAAPQQQPSSREIGRPELAPAQQSPPAISTPSIETQQQVEAPPIVEPVTPSPADSSADLATQAPSPAPAPASRAPSTTSRVDRAPPPLTAATRERNERIESLRRFKEMPPAYRAEFPPLTVDVHVYNADAQRSFVIINGKRYRNGDTLAEGPQIAEIVSEGIVFDWRNEKVLYTLSR